VDPETNELPHAKLETTTTEVLARSFLTELSEKHDVSDTMFLVDGSHSLQDECQRHGFDFRYEKHENRNAAERVYRRIKRQTYYFSDCFGDAEAETVDDWLGLFSFAQNQLIRILSPFHQGQEGLS